MPFSNIIYHKWSEHQQLTHTTGGTLPSSSKRCTDQSHRHQYTSVGLLEDFGKGKVFSAKEVVSAVEKGSRQTRSLKKDRSGKTYYSKSSRGQQSGSARHQSSTLRGRSTMRSYSDTTSTSSSDEGYGYYEMNKKKCEIHDFWTYLRGYCKPSLREYF